jgi:gliding motility-associated-like protein
VNVYPNPILAIDSILATGCDPLTVEFNDTVNTLPNLSYSWYYGDGNGSNLKNPSYKFEGAGTYNVSLTVTSEYGCTADNQKSPSLVIVYPKPIVDFSANPIITDMRNSTIVFKNLTAGALSHGWEFGDGDTSTSFSPSHTYGDTGTYKVVLTSMSSNGCISASELDIIIRAYYTIEVPNGFTPSSSSSGGNWRRDPESNRIFYPFTEKPEAVVEFEMLIFNRWGELIFESDDIYTGWDGQYRNVGVSQEVYVYKIKLKWENDQTFEKMGDVTLFR